MTERPPWQGAGAPGGGLTQRTPPKIRLPRTQRCTHPALHWAMSLWQTLPSRALSWPKSHTPAFARQGWAVAAAFPAPHCGGSCPASPEGMAEVGGAGLKQSWALRDRAYPGHLLPRPQLTAMRLLLCIVLVALRMGKARDSPSAPGF